MEWQMINGVFNENALLIIPIRHCYFVRWCIEARDWDKQKLLHKLFLCFGIFIIVKIPLSVRITV